MLCSMIQYYKRDVKLDTKQQLLSPDKYQFCIIFVANITIFIICHASTCYCFRGH
jgi:hypothetical protein